MSVVCKPLGVVLGFRLEEGIFVRVEYGWRGFPWMGDRQCGFFVRMVVFVTGAPQVVDPCGFFGDRV